MKSDFLIDFVVTSKNTATNLDQKFDWNPIQIGLKPIIISKLIQSPMLTWGKSYIKQFKPKAGVKQSALIADCAFVKKVTL